MMAMAMRIVVTTAPTQADTTKVRFDDAPPDKKMEMMLYQVNSTNHIPDMPGNSGFTLHCGYEVSSPFCINI